MDEWMEGRREGGVKGLFVCEPCTPSLIVLRELLKAKLSVSLRNLCHNGGASNAFDEKKETRRGGVWGELLSRFSKAIYLLAILFHSIL